VPQSPLVRIVASAICWVFYRVDRVGTPPAEGAALLLANHPNSLLDAVVIWATAARDIRFLAKSTLFETALGPIIKATGAIPVYRRLDHGADVSKNTEMFAAVGTSLAAGDAVCLFPEGISHSTGRLEPLRTGAARIALAAEHAGTRVALVPVGLNFERKTAFRSRATVTYGAPFSAADLAIAPDASAGAVRTLTDRIAERIRLLLVEADPEADAALVDRVDRLYGAARGRASNPEERIARRRAIAAGVERLREVDPDRYDGILLRLRRYDQRLRRFGIRDRHLDWQVSTGDALRFVARELALAVVMAPLSLMAMAVFAAPYYFTAFVSRRATTLIDVRATAKVVGGVPIYAAWLILLVAVAWWAAGPLAAVVTTVVLPAIAVAGLFAIERESAVADAVRTWFLLRRASPETRARLRRRRSELADVLDEVNQWLGEARVPADR